MHELGPDSVGAILPSEGGLSDGPGPGPAVRPGSKVPAPNYSRGRRSRRFAYSLVAVAIVSILVVLAVNPLLDPSAVAGTSRGSAVAPADVEDCNSHASTAKSALYVNQPEPTQNLSPGGRITSVLEFQVVNYTSSDNSIQLWLPSTDFTFPMVKGNFTYAIAIQSVAITGSGWLSPSALTKSEVVTGGIDFVHNGTARLSTQKLAVMATAAYGVITVEFRWHWAILQPNSTNWTTHGWSVPSWASGSKGNLPSIFFPAPYVSYLSGTGSSAYIGNNFTATLGGDVAGRYFFLEMEYASGEVEQSVGETAPADATTFNVTIILLNYDHYLVPATVLVHIHDVCGAILYNKVVKVTFIPEATVTFYLSPASCGGITFGGSTFPSGENGTFVPSTTAYNFSNPSCHGYTFSNWSTTGALHIATGHTMLVSGNGTFSVDYKPT